MKSCSDCSYNKVNLTVNKKNNHHPQKNNYVNV